MEISLLTSIGLTETQAKTYSYLLAKGPHTPPQLAAALQESRTNTYNVLERLVELSLVKRYEEKKKYMFQAEPPTALEKLVVEQRKQALQTESKLHASMPALLEQYFHGNEKPGVKFYQGKEQLKNIFKDQILTNETIYIIRSNYEHDAYDFEEMTEIRHASRKAGIKRCAITPDLEKSPRNWKESDPHMLLERTWMTKNDYTAPVEWNAYGNKVAIISYGDEIIGTIIESPQIAESFRQLYALIDSGLRNRPDYSALPVNANYLAATPYKK